jgi:hypothetical protein
MNDNQQTQDPAKALADIQALACVALESADPAVMRRDLEMILTTTEEALQPRVDHSRPCDPRTRTSPLWLLRRAFLLLSAPDFRPLGASRLVADCHRSRNALVAANGGPVHRVYNAI